MLGSFYFNPVLSLLGVGTALLLAAASLSLPALALGARGGHLTKPALLSGLERVMDPRRECRLPDGGRGKRKR